MNQLRSLKILMSNAPKGNLCPREQLPKNLKKLKDLVLEDTDDIVEEEVLIEEEEVENPVANLSSKKAQKNQLRKKLKQMNLKKQKMISLKKLTKNRKKQTARVYLKKEANKFLPY